MASNSRNIYQVNSKEFRWLRQGSVSVNFAFETHEKAKPERTVSLVVASKDGYRIFSLNNIDDNLELIHKNTVNDTYLVERLFSSCLVATVSMHSPRKLKVCHVKKGNEICNYSYSNSILAVRMNRLRLVVCLQESLHIHDIRDMRLLHEIRDTPPNPVGLIALTIAKDSCLLAYPGSATMGEVQIFDAFYMRAKRMIPAHESPLAAIAFTSTGSLIATASEKGTVIRVFATKDGQKLFEFCRGLKRCVDISSLTFSLCEQFLGCSSNTETVHIFKIEDSKQSSSSTAVDENTWFGYLASYLPSQVTNVFMQGRSFAVAYLPKTTVRNVTSLISINNQMRLLVATEDAKLYVYNVDVNRGGDIVLYKTYDLNDEELNKDRPDLPPSEPKSVDGGKTICIP